MTLELRLQLCTFESSTECNKISFDQHSFSENLKGLLNRQRNKHLQKGTHRLRYVTMLIDGGISFTFLAVRSATEVKISAVSDSLLSPKRYVFGSQG